MAFKSYAAKLKDPRWQEKRKDVLEHCCHQCQECESFASKLHVHHRAYVKGREPWEYDNNELIALCSLCHKKLHESKENLGLLIGELTSAALLDRVAGYVAALAIDAFAEHVDNSHKQAGYSDFYRITPEAVEWLTDKSGGKSPINRPVPLMLGVVGEK